MTTRTYLAPIVQLEFPNGWKPKGSKTLLYRVNFSKHTILERYEDGTCKVCVIAEDSEHAKILADSEITEIG